MKRYVVVGGRPYRSYTGTMMHTGLDVLGASDSLEEMEALVKEKFDDCSGLILLIDNETVSTTSKAA